MIQDTLMKKEVKYNHIRSGERARQPTANSQQTVQFLSGIISAISVAISIVSQCTKHLSLMPYLTSTSCGIP